MEINKVFFKTRFLKYLISSGMLFANTINAHRISAATQENIDIPKVVSYRSASVSYTHLTLPTIAGV